MSSPILEFRVDRTSIDEGESVTVFWETSCPETVSLCVTSEGTYYNIPLADSGSRSVPVPVGAKGKMTLRLSVSVNGKVSSEELVVKIKKAKVYRTTRVHNVSGNDLFSRIKLFCNRFSTGVHEFFVSLSYKWMGISPKRRLLIKVIVAFLLCLWIANLFQSIGYRAGYERGLLDGAKVEGRI